MPPFSETVARLGRPDEAAAGATAAHLDRLTKPRGSLGRLEAVAVQLAGIAGESPPPVPEPGVVAVFAGDHGVLAEGVSPWPAEVTAQMVANFCAGGAAINVLARHAGAGVVVVDVGVASELDAADGLVRAKARPGTANLAEEPAMTPEETTTALGVGADMAADLVLKGARCLVTGDMGIGSTTPSAALIAAFTGHAAPAVTGRGTGIGDDEWARKVRVVERGLARTGAFGAVPGDDPLAVLASLGGLEIAALAGFIVGGAAARVPVLVDGVIAVAAAVVAEALAPGCTAYCVAGHRSSEPGATVGLDHLGLLPLLDLELRLGEGTGACLALPVLQAAARIVREMATFDSAGVSDKT
ncbi:MAG: nicotinate-nucleotide--dimethylbenzimidazole phosphoribosyltransferase [Actinobacteria bacterium]|nr:MAG: nicotinate-nucleotide--dimethylbenzimidazole phosphoribosyltransferase [Actinomycetota bacterium]